MSVQPRARTRLFRGVGTLVAVSKQKTSLTRTRRFCRHVHQWHVDIHAAYEYEFRADRQLQQMELVQVDLKIAQMQRAVGLDHQILGPKILRRDLCSGRGNARVGDNLALMNRPACF